MIRDLPHQFSAHKDHEKADPAVPYRQGSQKGRPRQGCPEILRFAQDDIAGVVSRAFGGGRGKPRPYSGYFASNRSTVFMLRQVHAAPNRFSNGTLKNADALWFTWQSQ